MTTQVDLSRVWASTGATQDPDVTTANKYNTGWLVEIPPYQEFNYVLKGLDTNVLVIAEDHYLTWQPDINYKVGAKVKMGGIIYTCKVASFNNNPTTDVTNSYWVYGTSYGVSSSALQASHGVLYKNLSVKTAANWSGNELTLENSNTTIAFNSDLYNNWVLGNVKGEMVVVNTTNVGVPDGRNISSGQPNVFKLFHQGFKPVVSDVVGAVPTNLIDSKLYARRDSSWEELLTPTQAEAEAGVSTLNKIWSATRVKQAIQALGDIRYKNINAIDVPIGTVLSGYYSTPPSGFVELNGSVLLRSAYANLWAYAQATGITIAGASWPANTGLFGTEDNVTNFRLPDIRDMFIRSKDSVRSLGSYQADDFKSHTHGTGNIITNVTATGITKVISIGTGTTTGSTGGAETRPKNMALMSVIKY